MKFLSIVLLLFLLVATSCSDKRPKLKGHDYREIKFMQECQNYDFEIKNLTNEQKPNRNHTIKEIQDTSYTKDSEGIWMFDWDGEKYYHPVGMIHKANPYMSLYESTGEKKYLDIVRKYADKLISEAELFDSALYFPYKFRYLVHQVEDNNLEAPWYSGMGQGVILSLLVRLYQATDDSVYLKAADQTFNSFLRLKGEAEPWTVFVDDKGCYWIEEFPTETPSKTLNGFVFAIYGLYDYYQLTKSEESERVLKESINTIKNYIPYFRRDSLVSYYNLTYRHYASNYHYTHIKQLQMLTLMTGDTFFNDIADSFKVDFNKEKEPLFK